VRDGFESLKDRSVLLLGEEVGFESDLGLGNFSEEKMVPREEELKQAID
jgi:hypothetical protein